MSHENASFPTIFKGEINLGFRIALDMMVYFSPPKADFVKYADGGYAMITGGAGGIGKSFADQFGKLGINLYLVDFNESLLKATKKEMESKYPNILVKKGFTLDG